MTLEQLAPHPGTLSPPGFSNTGAIANFSLFSHHASKVVLGISLHREIKEFALNRTGDFWHIGIEGISEEMEYAFRVEGPHDAALGSLFSQNLWLADPMAKFPSTPLEWGDREKSTWTKCKQVPFFDWQNVTRPKIALADLIIYEMHVRGFTRHPSSQSSHAGKFLGIVDKIPYLKKLGINAVELMPIFEFDETHCQNRNPETGDLLVNYWGYNPLHFFAPMRRYAERDAIEEFRTVVRELHRAGIEVILDVVYNHTGEGKEVNYFHSFRGIDNLVYYMVDPQGRYRDFTGCGNTFNSNHPIPMQLILDSLCFWVDEMQVDGFRFDLASIHARGLDGKVIINPPLLEAIRTNPSFRDIKLIAEGWDAAGLYMVGSFPDLGPWSVWNGKFRDSVRNFIKGTNSAAGRFADVMCGSEFLYGKHTPQRSINFITAHDGFTLFDLVSYQQKHNISNGEGGKDGSDHSINWNCGVEGPTDNPQINQLRQRQMRNFFLALFLSQGVPMLVMGDEYGHTRLGNNNPYVHDNELNWFLWDLLAKRSDIFDFVSALIAFRKNCPELKKTHFLEQSDISWHGKQPNCPDWREQNRLVAYSLHSNPVLYIAFNADEHPVSLTLPEGAWRILARTDRPWKEHYFRKQDDAPLSPKGVELPPYSAIVLQNLYQTREIN